MEPDGPFFTPARYGENHALHLARGGDDGFAGLLDDYHRDSSDMVRFFAFRLMFDQLCREGIRGDVAEVGVYRGNTARLLAWMAARMGCHAYLLDTFDGFADGDLSDEERDAAGAFRDTSLEAVQARVDSDAAVYVPGRFPETAKHLPLHGEYGLVHIDCDIYAPIRAALEYFYPRLLPGGFMVVHDYASLHWPGAERAVDEFFAHKSESVIVLPDLCGSAMVRRAKAS